VITIHGRNPHDALSNALMAISEEGMPVTDSDDIVLDRPVTVVIKRPEECATYRADRGDDPFRDLKASLEMILSWDETEYAVHCLTSQGSCDTKVYDVPMRFHVSGRRMDLTAMCGTNDLANSTPIVASCLLLQHVARAADMRVGQYHHMTDGWKITQQKLTEMCDKEQPLSPYLDHASLRPTPLHDGDWSKFEADLGMYVDEGAKAMGYSTKFIRRVALPVLRAQQILKDIDPPTRFKAARGELDRCAAADWALACHDFIDAREKEWNSR
jgi:hypothetical protein